MRVWQKNWRESRRRFPTETIRLRPSIDRLSRIRREVLTNHSLRALVISLLAAFPVSWRDPTLPEVLEYLASPNNVIRLNAAGYLQHLTYHDDEMKQRTKYFSRKV